MAEKTSSHTKKTWGITKLPDFTGKKALVLPGAFYGSAVKMMAEIGCERADSVEDADIVVFIGGVDVDPALYDQSRLPETQPPSPARDKMEIDIYKACKETRKIMFGICRGAQFLHVMNGGSLWQHVEGHAGPDHSIYDVDEDMYIMANSYHHQMLQLHKDMNLIAICDGQISKTFKSADVFINLAKKDTYSASELEIEAGSYEGSRCFFVQGHPEVGSPEYKSWCLTKLSEFCEGYSTWHVNHTEPVESSMAAWSKARNVLAV